MSGSGAGVGHTDPMTQTPDPTRPADPTPGASTPPVASHDATGSASKRGSGTPAASSTSTSSKDPLRSSRTSGFYSAVIGLGVVLVLLVIFIIQNTDSAVVRFLGWEGRAPQAVLLLIAVAAGIFLTATAGSLRLLQVRRRVKKERKA